MQKEKDKGLNKIGDFQFLLYSIEYKFKTIPDLFQYF